MRMPDKKVEKALMGKDKHRVLLFGKRTFGPKRLTNIESNLWYVDQIRFPDEHKKWKDLSSYTLVILDYSTFYSTDEEIFSTDEEIVHPKEIFEKQMIKALTRGTSFCILHYDEDVPEYNKSNPQEGWMSKEDARKYRQLQVGFRWLNEFSIRPFRHYEPIMKGQLKRNEFKGYIENWGTSKIVFKSYGKGSYSDIIYQLDEDFALAFTLNFRAGKLIYMPCQRNFYQLEVLTDTFRTLIDSLITYLAKIRIEPPKWANVPIFSKEEKLVKEKADLEYKLEKKREELNIFNSAKQLLFQSEYGLEEALPRFLSEQCGILTKREETYLEDFWLLDDNKERIAICEVKSYNKGFKKTGLFNLYNHRDEYNLGDTFPAILFVNANLNAVSWEQKNKPIDKQDYRKATDKHILIVRIEDLLFAWQALKEGVITANQLLNIFRKEVGWLRFRKDSSWEILK